MQNRAQNFQFSLLLFTQKCFKNWEFVGEHFQLIMVTKKFNFVSIKIITMLIEFLTQTITGKVLILMSLLNEVAYHYKSSLLIQLNSHSKKFFITQSKVFCRSLCHDDIKRNCR
jgi:hypothetical protein